MAIATVAIIAAIAIYRPLVVSSRKRTVAYSNRLLS
jgi:hypothetical protein